MIADCLSQQSVGNSNLTTVTTDYTQTGETTKEFSPKTDTSETTTELTDISTDDTRTTDTVKSTDQTDNVGTTTGISTETTVDLTISTSRTNVNTDMISTNEIPTDTTENTGKTSDISLSTTYWSTLTSDLTTIQTSVTADFTRGTIENDKAPGKARKTSERTDRLIARESDKNPFMTSR